MVSSSLPRLLPQDPLHEVCFNVDDKSSCSNVSSSAVEPDCVSAEVNIVEEEQKMWRRITKRTKFQPDAGRRSALLVSPQRVKLHFVAESMITSKML